MRTANVNVYVSDELIMSESMTIEDTGRTALTEQPMKIVFREQMTLLERVYRLKAAGIAYEEARKAANRIVKPNKK